MAACQGTKIEYRPPTRAREVKRLYEGASIHEAFQDVPTLLVCSLPVRHRGACDWRTPRWIVVRAVARIATVLVLMTALWVATGIIPDHGMG